MMVLNFIVLKALLKKSWACANSRSEFVIKKDASET